MLYILNAKERNQAFLQFFVFFFLTVALIVGAIYFNFSVPVQLNEKLSKEIDAHYAEELGQRKFVTTMKEVRTYLDSLEKGGSKKEQVDIALTEKLRELYAVRGSDNGLYGSMNQAVFETFSQLKEKLKTIEELEGEVKKGIEYKQEWEKCKSEVRPFEKPPGLEE